MRGFFVWMKGLPDEPTAIGTGFSPFNPYFVRMKGLPDEPMVIGTGFSPFNPYFVRMKGLEPSRLAALDPKSSASTNFATSAIINERCFVAAAKIIKKIITNQYSQKICF